MKNIIVTLGFLICCAGCAAYESRVVGPAMEGVTGLARVEPEYVDVWLDCGQSGLGAYHVEVHYDPAVVAISRIESAPSSMFSGSPMAKVETFVSGSTPIIGLAPGVRQGAGRIAVARVFFKPVSEGRSRISVSIRSLYNPESKSIQGIALLSSDEVTVFRR